MTALCQRKFSFWVTHPLRNLKQIHERQNAISLLKNNSALGQNLHIELKKIPDIEKNISRLSCGYTHAKDLLATRNTLCLIPNLRNILEPLQKQNPLFGLDEIGRASCRERV